MITISSSDLGDRMAELMRQVRETGEVVEITEDGRAVARLVPAEVSNEATTITDTTSAALAHPTAWEELDKLIAQIGKHLVGETDAVEIVRSIRREL